MKKQRRKIGDIVRIPLTDGRNAFAMILPIADAFFDIVVNDDEVPSIQEILKRPVIFQIPVMNYAVTKGLWTIIGHSIPSETLLETPKFFIQSPMDGSLYITTSGEDRHPATYEQCISMERCSVWDPEHVVTRLEDHFAGRPNKWYEIQRPKRITT